MMNDSSSSTDGRREGNEGVQKQLEEDRDSQCSKDGQLNSVSATATEPSSTTIPLPKTAKLFQGYDLYLGSNQTAPEYDVSIRPSISEICEDLKTLVRSLEGDKILILLPTDNPQKLDVYKNFFPADHQDFVFEKLPGIDSGVCFT